VSSSHIESERDKSVQWHVFCTFFVLVIAFHITPFFSIVNPRPSWPASCSDIIDFPSNNNNEFMPLFPLSMCPFLPRCMECRRGSDENSACPSVCLSKEWFVTKRKKRMPRFLHRMKNHLAFFSEKMRRRMVGERWPLLPQILGQPAPVGAKSPSLNRYSLVAPHRNT